MLLPSTQCIQGIILLICFINPIKSDEALASLNSQKEILNDQQQPTVTSGSSKKDLNAENLEALNTLAKTTDKSAIEDIDFIALSLQNIATTGGNLHETTTTTTTFTTNDAKDKESSPNWELIYPEPKSSVATSEPAPAPVPVSNENFKASLPTYFKVDDVTNCQKFFGACLKQVLAKIVPKLKGANKSPSLDPLYFNATAFQYNSGPFTGYITIRYALVYGLTSIKFKKVDFYNQNDKFKARLSMVVPKMSVIGAYKGDLHVNNVRVRPRGDFNVTMTALAVEMLSLGILYERDDHVFLKFIKANATTALKDSKINATGIFPDQRLNEIVVNVANQYWRDLFNVVLPETRNNWLPILLDALNAALEMVPFDFFAIKS